ncbi:hypothetical protein [Nocardia mangyaensis]|uniref:hypothetical protein n=1 Tax=Nocardia mangyaensis TaxID=2213200 RepID=UPI0026772779|nr:hypothetical protein [Nocardia mangyaensis]MDO3651178.1 hypothetical protein [Nocardia mangyaensis]
MSVRLSPRDMVALTILTEMYGAPLDVVAAMLGVSINRAYRITAKWEAARMLSARRVRPVPGPSWVVPTRSAAESLLGRPTRFWVPSPKMAAHTKAVLQLRLALVGLDLDRWVSERQLRSEVSPTAPGQVRTHIHDGRFYTEAGDLIAVEVEVTTKNAAQARTAMWQALRAAEAAECTAVHYYASKPEIRALLRRTASELDLSTGPRPVLFDLDKALGLVQADTDTAAGERAGLRVITGGISTETGKAV